MLLLHEVHTLVGAEEDAFEAHVRDHYMPALAQDDGARLGWYCRLAFGTGRAYQATTMTLLADGAAYERLARRVQTGDLRSWAAEADHYRHEVTGKLLLPAEWSPWQGVDLASVPTTPVEHDQALFMQDSAWPHEAKLDEYLTAACDHYAPSLEQRSERSLLELEAVFQAAIGAPRRREVILWQRVVHPERLPGLFTRDLPAEVRQPGTWMHDALAVRDDWESALLRTAPWSPLT